ncbi:hypothetical protein DPSP01_010756 [Paraphaeosphaeria sporulosa]|uniref:DUF7053 domain-containing protein n=1 Tax=Paraphaeosphaeria sporulosa TaxID=1460663 RepID=A0A177CXD5_9PLEO|nr:uncharacterized protein CC84DRAFT_1159069 [Paraphaeosphaeria sporulosa]OAG11562.1 hypothetical protein CC84DRAFT_1159069 [Paraphaeosphaeria sporulosa]
MRAKHDYHTAAPIPPHVSRDQVLAALHDHTTCLTLQALTTTHSLLPTTDPATLKDTFWYPPDTYPVCSYRVTETIAFLPWFSWAKYRLTFPSVFQNTPTGLKTRADTGGVVLRAEFRVLEGSTMEGIVEGEGEGLGEVGWVLVEDVEVVCAWWMMPLVRGKMEEAHRDICRKVVEKVVKEVAKREGENCDVAVPGEKRIGEVDGDHDVRVDPLAQEEDAYARESVDLTTRDQAPDKITYA